VEAVTPIRLLHQLQYAKKRLLVIGSGLFSYSD
jgi:hypothetical protein